MWLVIRVSCAGPTVTTILLSHIFGFWIVECWTLGPVMDVFTFNLVTEPVCYDPVLLLIL